MAVEINGDGLITVDGTSTTQGRVRLKEDTDNGSNYVELTAPASVTANRTITFPDDTGTVLTNSGNQTGVFSALTVNSNNISADNSLGFRNRIINGDMRIDQRNAGASVSLSSTPQYPVDRFAAQINTGLGSGHTAQRSSTTPTGFSNSVLITIGTGGTPSGTNVGRFAQVIEGFNVADLAYGTANAKTSTVSFWVRSSVTGTYGCCLTDASTRVYMSSYTVSSANTWEYKTLTFPGCTDSTWDTTNGAGLYLGWDLGEGPDRSVSAGSWTTLSGLSKMGLTGGTKIVATSGATFYITGVQLEVGSVATPFERRPYGTELALCYRYFQKFLGTSAYEALPSYAISGSGGTAAEGFIAYKNTMRAAPTLSVSTLCLLDAVSVFALTGASMLNAGVDSARINYTGASGLTQYRSYYITANNSTSAFLTLSSEL